MANLMILFVLFCTTVDHSLAVNRQKQLETTIFGTDYAVKPENMEKYIAELNNIYSTGNGAYKGLIATLAEVPRLSSCTDSDFMKFDLLQGQSRYSNVESYLRDQLVSFSKKCDQKLVNKFFGITSRLDRRTYDLIYRLSFLMNEPYGLDHVVGRPLFTTRTLVKGIFKLLEEKKPAMYDTEMITKSELDSLYKSYVVTPCAKLTTEFDSMGRFYIRNFLDRGTLRYCDDISKGWTYRAELCSKVLADNGNLPNLVYKAITMRYEDPKIHLYQIMDAIPRN